MAVGVIDAAKHALNRMRGTKTSDVLIKLMIPQHTVQSAIPYLPAMPPGDAHLPEHMMSNELNGIDCCSLRLIFANLC